MIKKFEIKITMFGFLIKKWIECELLFMNVKLLNSKILQSSVPTLIITGKSKDVGFSVALVSTHSYKLSWKWGCCTGYTFMLGFSFMYFNVSCVSFHCNVRYCGGFTQRIEAISEVGEKTFFNLDFVLQGFWPNQTWLMKVVRMKFSPLSTMKSLFSRRDTWS